ncbi:MAG: glycoside hydrolase family 3 protein [Lachnospiraceae bacterium]|nr:glycoside hydrolase family 3 protein [Lachnospiraceae bacterium]
MKKRQRKRLITILTALLIVFVMLSAYLGTRVITLEKQLKEAEQALRESAEGQTGDEENNGQPVVLMTEEEAQENTSADLSADPASQTEGNTSGLPGTTSAGEKKGAGLPETAAAGEKKDTAQTADPASPDSALEKEIEAEARSVLEKMTTAEKVGQLFFVTPEALTGAGQVTRAGDATREAVRRYAVGGIIYFQQNLVEPGQTKALLQGTKDIYAELGLPEPFLTTDEEGGTVVRIADNSAFGVKNVGNMRSIKDAAEAGAAGHTIGAYMAELGFNMDFAPVADVITNPSNTVVAERAFGSDPQFVKDCVTAQSDALLEEGILPVWKHFPGHGSTEADTHAGYAYTDKSMEDLLAEDLVPYENAGEHAPCIMAAHISLPNAGGNDLPATLSENIITGILREKLGYDGVVITDALNMGAIANTYSSADAAKKAILAGCDMLLMPYSFSSAYEGVLAAAESGEITEERIDESVMRILKCKIRMQEKRNG